MYVLNQHIVKIIKEEVQKFLNQYYSNIGMSIEDAFNLIDYHSSFRNLYPGYDKNDNEYEEEFYFDSKEIAYQNVDNILDIFNSLPNPIPIFRTIKVKSIDEINYDYLGDSWSFDKQSAIDFANNQAGGNVLLSAKTYFDNVDWKNTISAYFLYSDLYNSESENEITIIDSDKLFDVTANYL
jgi:hypothetical protein